MRQGSEGEPPAGDSRGRGEPPAERRWTGVLPLPLAVSRAYPDLAPYIERYAVHFGELPLKEPPPGSPNGGRRPQVVIDNADLERDGPIKIEFFIFDKDSREDADSGLVWPVPEYWVPPAPGVHPGAELARRLRESTTYELLCRADGGDWEPIPISMLTQYPIDYRGSRCQWGLELGMRVRPAARAAKRPAPSDPRNSQSAKEQLRQRVKKKLEAEAACVPWRANSKPEWLRLMKQEYGSAVTDNLFETAWHDAKLPAAWRAPGRRT